MRNYFDFILCEIRGKRKLFYAPAWSCIERGDMVIVSTDDSEMMANVLACITLSDEEKKEIDFIMRATGAPKNLDRVISKVVFQKMEYEEDKT